MIPSLVASEIRRSLVDYLATTFSLSDDGVRTALADFLTDPGHGIFRGPYLRVRTPFRSVSDNWVSPLGWLPEWFVPYQHQATAFERLSTAAGHEPLPTLVTTGTGSGKTECFLMPILDHCARQRDAGQGGIKALIMYPMNALATDQAGRLAELIANEPRLSGLTAGIYIGQNGGHSQMGAGHLIDDRHALRTAPPDILLTNYKMLDFLLLRRDDHELWASNGPDTLRYVVLDEFHTYDGAQGTDVAMLLRRLGATLGMATAGRPLGGAAPVATSATLGTEADALVDLRDFAHKVFGVEFAGDAVVGETRQTVEEACRPTDHDLPIPSVSDVAEIADDDFDGLVSIFLRAGVTDLAPLDTVDLGERLLAHPLTRAVLLAVADRPRSLEQAVIDIAARVREWGPSVGSRPDLVAEALSRYLALLSIARRRVGGRDRPLFGVEVQLWVREVSRLLRAVGPEPTFRWLDAPAAAALPEEESAEPQPDDLELPAVYCRRCGHAGWMATASELHDALSGNPGNVYRAALNRSTAIRVLMLANPLDPAAVNLDPLARRIVAERDERTVAVHITPDEDAARRQTCPACGEADSVRFVGLAIASLASVTINTMFGSPNVGPDEQKLLAFTDSVQDASHRAAFFSGRTHRFNLRSLMSAALQDAGHDGLTLADLGDVLMNEAHTPRQRFGLLPPDLQRDPVLRSAWSEEPEALVLEVLGRRVGFETDLEFGLRSRVGRTLEQSVAAAAHVDLGDPDDIYALAAEALRDVVADVPDTALAGLDGYLLGIADRLRTAGAIINPLLAPYIAEGGKQWFIWGGRPNGLPPFTPDQGRPTFATTAAKSDFDSITALSPTPTWYVDWAVRSLGLESADARSLNHRVISILSQSTDSLVKVDAAGGQQVFGLDRRSVRAFDIADDGDVVEPAIVRCDLCGGAHTVAPIYIDRWVGVPCRRYRCPGHFQIAPIVESGYYRRFYRHGKTRRVVTGEHTGLLNRRDREALETAFKQGTAPDAPNVLTATPTLEMGIDIGDLSAVMLTSVPRNPSSYIQRVGRAGRATGNALVTTFVRSDTHGLYYLADPEAMLAGAVRPPNCYLEATETLERQYIAYLMDRLADRTIDGLPPGNRIGDVMKSVFDPEGLFRTLIDSSIGNPAHVAAFASLFGEHLGDRAVAKLTDFAGSGIEARLKAAADEWHERKRELELRRTRLASSIEKLEEEAHRSDDAEEELRSLRGQRSAVIALLREHRNEYPLSALERLGVLPNYTLVDDAITLSATLWARTKSAAGDEYHTEIVEYARSGRVAIQEFAPGNSFYAGGHRHYIDALEIGVAQEPLYETWRICPDCAYAAIEVSGETPTGCARCGGAGIADIGSRHTLLRLRKALASGSEESARVYDETDDRTRESYEIITLVDPDPADVSGAWLLSDKTFGAELCTRTRLRTLNLGISERPGEKVPIAGADRHVSRFTVCRHCGAVRETRDDRRGAKAERLHQGWCKVRSGAVPQQWDPLVLLHELTTEAIRFLVPVSMFEVDERLASFKAALLLGIRAELGGNPDHLTVTSADAPNRNGQGRRRFLVLYDEIPGGTGYLGPLADPARIKAILTAARETIARCPCRSEGRPACHRCLLGVVDRWEYDLVRRELAKEILDSLLEDWGTPSPVPTIADASLARVEESELERRFKVALREWAHNERNADVRFTRVPGTGRFEAFELSIGFGGDVVRYRIAEQQGLSTSPSTLPDFLITRMDATGPDVAVYLDGFQYHASSDHNEVADDSRKRDGVRASGRLVWNLTWTDVEQFHRAVTDEIPRRPPDRSLLDAKAKGLAQQIHKRRGGVVGVRALEQNPVALLLDYLVYPNTQEWKLAVLSAVGGMAATSGQLPLDAQSIELALDASLAAQPVVPAAPNGEVVAYLSNYTTPGGLGLSLILDAEEPNSEQWTVISALPDDPASLAEPTHPLRWADWLPWANLLQFLGLPHQRTGAVIAGASQSLSDDHDDLWLRDVSKARDTAAPHGSVAGIEPGEVSVDQEEELNLMDPDVGRLARQAVALGFTDVVAGLDIGVGSPLEAAWPGSKVAVLLDDAAAPEGWQARSAEAWTLDELIAALSGSATEDN